MKGPYDVSETPDFYAAFGHGSIDAERISDYVLRLTIANNCTPGARVVDVGCGTGLQLPLLYEYAPTIDSYTGLEIAPSNIAEARERVAELDQLHDVRDFTINILEWDIASAWPDLGIFDIAVYTATLQRLPRDAGIQSLRNIASHLTPGGTLYLTTCRPAYLPAAPTQAHPPVYAWHKAETLSTLGTLGFVVEQQTGLAIPNTTSITHALEAMYGTSAAAWYECLRQRIPAPFLAIAEAAALPHMASEVLYICRLR